MSPYLEKLTAIDVSAQPLSSRKPTWQRRAELAFVLVIVAVSVAAALYAGTSPPEGLP